MFWFGLLLCALLGVDLGGTVAGAIHLTDDTGHGVALFVVCVNLVPWTGIGSIALLTLAGRRAARAAEAARPPLPALRPVLARIEASRALGDGPDLPLFLSLTVAPDGAPGYRADIHATVNLMDMDDYKAGRIVVAAHDPDRPWRVALEPRPSAEWRARAALAKIDSAPVSTLAARPLPVWPPGERAPRSAARPGLYAVLLGLAASVPLFWNQFTG